MDKEEFNEAFKKAMDDAGTLSDMELAVKEFLPMVPALLELHMGIYVEAKTTGYTETQSFELATRLLLQVVKGN